MDGMGNINQLTAEVPEHKPFGLETWNHGIGSTMFCSFFGVVFRDNCCCFFCIVSPEKPSTKTISPTKKRFKYPYHPCMVYLYTYICLISFGKCRRKIPFFHGWYGICTSFSFPTSTQHPPFQCVPHVILRRTAAGLLATVDSSLKRSLCWCPWWHPTRCV